MFFFFFFFFLVLVVVLLLYFFSLFSVVGCIILQFYSAVSVNALARVEIMITLAIGLAS